MQERAEKIGLVMRSIRKNKKRNGDYTNNKIRQGYTFIDIRKN